MRPHPRQLPDTGTGTCTVDGHRVVECLWRGTLFGAVAQRSHFCTMGAIADIVNFADWSRMRMWAIALAVAILGFNTMVALGLVQATSSIYSGPRLLWLSLISGGLLFGFAMVLASGCGSKNLVRAGAGSLRAWVVLLVMRVSAFATLKGISAVARVITVDRVSIELAVDQDLSSLLAAASLGLLTAALLLVWVLRAPQGRDPLV